MKLNENPLHKSLLPQNKNNPLHLPSVNLSDIPDFLYPEKDQKNSELFKYLTQIINWSCFSLNDIYEKQANKNNLNFIEWKKEIESIDKEKKNRIINNVNKSSKLLIESVIDYMKYLNIYFYKIGEKVRSFIFLEYFLKKLETDIYIISTDEYCKLYKLYFNLCRDTDNIFEHLEINKILINNELFYYEKGCYYERIHKFREANQIYVEGFINILDDNNNDIQKGRLLQNQYINFEDRMKNRITRDLEALDDDWESIDKYMHKKIKEYKEKNFNSKNINSNRKYFLNNYDEEENIEEKLIKYINYNFSLTEGRLNLDENNNINNGTEVIGSYGSIKFIKNPPDINKVTNITYIYEFLKMTLSSFYPEWKKDYDNFDLEVKANNDKLPYSWISKLRPTKRNIQNIQDNNKVLNLVQKEYMNTANINGNNINNNNNNRKYEIENNLNNSHNEDINIKEDNKINDHEISNILSNMFLIDKKEENNNIENNQNISININTFENENKENKNNNNKDIQQYKLMKKDTNTILDNIQYQIEHPPYKNISKVNQNNGKEENKSKKKKKNKFKCVGTLNFDQDGLVLINLSNENDLKIDIVQSASKILNNKDNDKNEEKKQDKKYTITLDNIPRRIKYVKEKTLKEKKLYEKRKQEMLQGVNFDYLNSFKKLFETYPELNNLLENDQLINNKNKIEEYKLDLIKNEDKKNLNIAGETNIQTQNGPSEAMRLLLEVYGIPQNFLEENNPFIEYAKKNGIENNFVFENLFKDIKSYINAKSSKRKRNIFQFNKNNNSKEKNKAKEDKGNIDADGDLIIESESDDFEKDNKDNKDNNKKKDSKISKNKGSKHCVFDSKKNSQIVYSQTENNNEEEKEGFAKIIDDINKKAEKGIKIGEKTIFSNYKGIKEHSFNNNDKSNENEEKFKLENNNINDIDKNINNSLMVNKSIELSTNKDGKKEEDKEQEKNKEQEEINRNKILVTNSKISADIFMNAFNYRNNDNNANLSINQQNNKNNSKKNKKILNDTSIKQKQNPLSNSLSSDNFNNYDSNYYSEAIKNSKSKQSKLRTLPTNNEPKITNFKAEKEKKLSNIKEKYSIEKENTSKNKNMKNDNKIKESNINIEKDNNKKNKYNVNIGNIYDLDNFDDLFK